MEGEVVAADGGGSLRISRAAWCPELETQHLEGPRWHLLAHLQRNKVTAVIVDVPQCPVISTWRARLLSPGSHRFLTEDRRRREKLQPGVSASQGSVPALEAEGWVCRGVCPEHAGARRSRPGSAPGWRGPCDCHLHNKGTRAPGCVS